MGVNLKSLEMAGFSRLAFLLYAAGCLEAIWSFLSLYREELALAQGCGVSTKALAAFGVLGGCLMMVQAFDMDNLAIHWLASVHYILVIMLGYSLGPVGNGPMRVSCAIAFLLLVWMNIPSKQPVDTTSGARKPSESTPARRRVSPRTRSRSKRNMK